MTEPRASGKLYRPLVVTAELDAPAIASTPIHFDALIMLVEAQRKGGFLPGRDTPLSELPHVGLPILYVTHRGVTIYAASAWELSPDAEIVRSDKAHRKDAWDIEEMTSAVTPGSGPGRDRIVTQMSVCARTVSWRIIANARRIRQDLRAVQWLGQDGQGLVRRWTVEVGDYDPIDVWVRGGKTTRHLPPEWTSFIGAPATGACEPPYWHPWRLGPIVPLGSQATLLPTIIAEFERQLEPHSRQWRAAR